MSCKKKKTSIIEKYFNKYLKKFLLLTVTLLVIIIILIISYFLGRKVLKNSLNFIIILLCCYLFIIFTYISFVIITFKKIKNELIIALSNDLKNRFYQLGIKEITESLIKGKIINQDNELLYTYDGQTKECIELDKVIFNFNPICKYKELYIFITIKEIETGKALSMYLLTNELYNFIIYYHLLDNDQMFSLLKNDKIAFVKKILGFN